MDNFNIKKFFKDQYITEGSCGYTPDGNETAEEGNINLERVGLDKYWKY